jgi:hypothetical protein
VTAPRTRYSPADAAVLKTAPPHALACLNYPIRAELGTHPARSCSRGHEAANGIWRHRSGDPGTVRKEYSLSQSVKPMLADRLSAVLPRLEPGAALLARMLALTVGNLPVTGRGGDMSAGRT